MWSRITGNVCNSAEVYLTVYLAHDLLAMAEVKNAERGSGFKSKNVAIPKYHSFHKMHWEILDAKKKKKNQALMLSTKGSVGVTFIKVCNSQ